MLRYAGYFVAMPHKTRLGGPPLHDYQRVSFKTLLGIFDKKNHNTQEKTQREDMSLFFEIIFPNIQIKGIEDLKVSCLKYQEKFGFYYENAGTYFV